MITLGGDDICYNCKFPFSEVGASDEHIIPDALGGKGLISNNLLCRKCNNEWGASIDNGLIAQLGSIADLIGAKRDRKNEAKQIPVSSDNPNITSIQSGGKRNYRIQIPIPDTNDTIKLNDKTPKGVVEKAKKLVNQLAMKYGQFSDIDIEKEIFWTVDPPCMIFIGNHLEGNKRFVKIGRDSLLGIVKILVSYGGSEGVPFEELERPLRYLNQRKATNRFLQPYYVDGCLGNESISHTIYLKGSPEDHLLFAYIELFGTCCFIALMNSNYHGPELESAVSVDLLTGKRSQPLIKIGLSFERLHSIPYWSIRYWQRWAEGKDLSFNRRKKKLLTQVNKILSDKKDYSSEKSIDTITNRIRDISGF